MHAAIWFANRVKDENVFNLTDQRASYTATPQWV